MKKFLPLLIVSILMIGGCGTLVTATEKTLEKTQTISFSALQISEQNTYATVSFSNSNTFVKSTGFPLLPAYRETYVFPFGTKINDVSVSFSNQQTYQITKDITPSPIAQTQVAGKPIYQKNTDTKQIIGMYPEQQFISTVTAGIQGTEHVFFLNVLYYPVRYDSQQHQIIFSEKATTTISYTLPENTVFTADEYNLVIIAPESFSSTLQPLVDHKNSHGIQTLLKTTESIYSEYTGVDQPEQIKYFIKDAIETMGVDYVLLVGGQQGQKRSWYVPVRYANLDDDSNFEASYISDLYYADIYDGTGNFSSWDPNGNGIFAEWIGFTKEVLDLVPDVYLGRLPCRSVRDVGVLVDKIIAYETGTAGQTWFNDMVVVGGDSAPGDPYYEGEAENQQALDYMTGFTGVKRWTSDGSLTGQDSVIQAISGGCGFLFFDGHGNPSVWSTHPPNNGSVWIQGLINTDMRKLSNGEKLPVAVVGGCHNAQFNVSLMRILEGIKSEGLKYFQRTFYYKDWVPECWAWKMVQVKQGGAIAIMGFTALDWFATGDGNSDGIPDCTQFFSGYANTHFFKNYGVNGKTILGQAHTQTLIDFIADNPPMGEKLDCKTVQEFVLLGDPTLQIGGYP
jgi:hypothetical protein